MKPFWMVRETSLGSKVSTFLDIVALAFVISLQRFAAGSADSAGRMWRERVMRSRLDKRFMAPVRESDHDFGLFFILVLKCIFMVM